MSIASTPPPTQRRTAPLAQARDNAQDHARDHLRAVPPLGPAATAPAMPPVVSAGLAVPTLFGTVDYANFDHAASTPALVAVKRAVDTALQTYSSVHRGNGYASRVTSAWYEQAREEVRAFVGARPGDELVFTRNSTDSFNLLARALPRHTSVFVFQTEHHAALLPWKPERTHRLPVPGSARDAEILLRSALEADRARTKLVVLAGASNVTGEIWPVQALAAVAHRYGARVVLDAAQYAPHRPVDLAELGVDYAVLSGHKLYAPFGAGILVGPADWLDAAAPYLAGGGATRVVSERAVDWHQGAARHEAGSPNVIGAIALAAACSTLGAHAAAVEAHESALGRALAEGLAAIEGVQTYSIFAADHERVAVSTFTIDGLDSGLVSTALSAEYGIGVRDGKFCAHLCVDALLDDGIEDHGIEDHGIADDAIADEAVESDAPTTAVRASVGLATTHEHVARLLSAVAHLAEHGPAGDYTRTEAGWVLADDPREVTPPRPW